MNPQLQRAQDFYAAGEFGKAEAFCRSLLQLEPDNARALHLLGEIAREAGQDQAAMALIGQAIEKDPAQPEWYLSLETLLRRNGHAQTALQLYAVARQHCPGSALIRIGEGMLQAELKNTAAAEAAFREALSLDETAAEAWFQLALLLKEQKITDAAEACSRAISADDSDARFWLLTGELAQKQEQPLEALKAYLRALALSPTGTGVYLAIGRLLAAHPDDGALSAELADFAPIPHLRLGVHFFMLKYHHGRNESDQALAEGIKGLALEDNPLLRQALAEVCLTRGDAAAALEHYRRAEELLPDAPEHRSRRAELASRQLFLQLALPGFDDKAQAQRLRDWDARFGKLPAGAIPGEIQPSDGNRRLRIGYVSADFCQRSAVLMHLLLFAHHDPKAVEIYCYSNVASPDDTTRRLRARVPKWRSIHELSDEQAAGLIRQDRIDVLVDLNGHSEGHRLGVFARRPAPVQLTGLGFGVPTAVSAFSARLTDAALSPPAFDTIYDERLIRLSQLLHWQTPSEPAPLTPLPSAAKGHVTFASGNALYKLSAETLAAWAEILTALPTARLKIKAPELSDEGIRAVLSQRLAEHGIEAHRVDLLGRTGHHEHLAFYASADIALDSFPYQGGFSACEPLWMGLPVIASRGGTRAADSVLTAIGRPEWIGETTADYVRIAVALAQDPQALSAARQQLRQQIESSPIMDGPGFARELEKCYLSLWQEAAGQAGAAAETAPKVKIFRAKPKEV